MSILSEYAVYGFLSIVKYICTERTVLLKCLKI